MDGIAHQSTPFPQQVQHRVEGVVRLWGVIPDEVMIHLLEKIVVNLTFQYQWQAIVDGSVMMNPIEYIVEYYSCPNNNN